MAEGEEPDVASAAAGVGDTVAALERADLEAALGAAQKEAAAASLRAQALEKTNVALTARLRRALRSQASATPAAPAEATGDDDTQDAAEGDGVVEEGDASLEDGNEDMVDELDETAMLRGLLAAREADLKAVREELRDVQEAYKAVSSRLRRFEGEQSDSDDGSGAYDELYAQERQRQAELMGQMLEAPAAFAATFRDFLASSASGINQASTSLASAVFGEEPEDDADADSSTRQSSRVSMNRGGGFGLMKMLSKSEMLNEAPPRKQQ